MSQSEYEEEYTNDDDFEESTIIYDGKDYYTTTSSYSDDDNENVYIQCYQNATTTTTTPNQMMTKTIEDCTPKMNNNACIIENNVVIDQYKDDDNDGGIDPYNYNVIESKAFYNAIKESIDKLEGASEMKRRVFNELYKLYIETKKRDKMEKVTRFECLQNKSMGSGKSVKRKIFIIMKKYIKSL